MAGVQAALRASQEASKLGDTKAYDALEGDFQEVTPTSISVMSASSAL
jgi:hypothetical protein